MWVMWTTVWWYQRMTHLSKLHFKWVSSFLTMCMATTVKLYRLVIVLHELFCSSIHVAASMNEALQTNMLEPLINHVYLLLWSCCLCTLKLIVASVDCTKNITWTLSTLLKCRLLMHVLDIQWPIITCALPEAVMWTSQFWCWNLTLQMMPQELRQHWIRLMAYSRMIDTTFRSQQLTSLGVAPQVEWNSVRAE